MPTYTAKILSITCNAKSDPTGDNDEVWFFYQADAGIPVRYPYGAIKTQNMAPGQTWTFGTTDNPPIEVTFENDLQITLWDQDMRLDINLTDFLGNADITPSTSDGSVLTATNGDSSNYTIKWQRVNWGV